MLVSPPIYLSPNDFGDPRVRAQVGAYLKVYEFMRNNKEFTIGASAQLVKLFALGKTLDITERNWTPFVLSLQHCIESQTTVSDIASVAAPVDVVYGALDQFLAPGPLKIVEQMRNVTMHRVEVSDHVLRTRLRARCRAGDRLASSHVGTVEGCSSVTLPVSTAISP